MFIINKKTLNSDNSPAKKVLFEKRIDGRYYVVEAVADTGRLSVISAYKNKATEQQTGDVQAPPSNVRNASPDVASGDIVSQPEDIVNVLTTKIQHTY